MSRRIEQGSQEDGTYVNGYVTYYPTAGEARAELKVTASATNAFISNFGATMQSRYDGIPGETKNNVEMAVMRKFTSGIEKGIERELGDVVEEVMAAAKIVLETQVASWVEQKAAEVEEFIDSELKKEGY